MVSTLPLSVLLVVCWALGAMLLWATSLECTLSTARVDYAVLRAWLLVAQGVWRLFLFVSCVASAVSLVLGACTVLVLLDWVGLVVMASILTALVVHWACLRISSASLVVV